MSNKLSWFGIFRLGLVQTALGALVVLSTSTLNRIMVVELALPAVLPGALITLHHAMQVLRPRMGHGSDEGQRRTPWIIGGMAALALGGAGASVATVVMASHFVLGLLLSVVAFAVLGAGVSAAGTSLLVLMAKRVADERKAGAATVVWLMMIAGFAVTASLAGRHLEPYSSERLLLVSGTVAIAAFVVSVLAIWGVEGAPARDPEAAEAAPAKRPFREAFREVWAEPDARRFTLFVFLAMLAYSAQDLILEPFAGSSFGFSPGASTKLSGVQHAGVFVGMLLVAFLTAAFKRTPLASLKGWVVAGCIASALAMVGLTIAGIRGGAWPLKENVFVLGVANGVFCIAAIGSMMLLASRGRTGREGMRMGIWGAAQAIAFGGGGFLGTVLHDVSAKILGPSSAAYAVVFGLEALGFFAAHWLALGTDFGGVTAPNAAGAAPRTAGN
jgi:BCD family chlorophyll transporter-like MFS transporter